MPEFENPFDRLDALLSESVLSRFGIPVRIIPQLPSRYGAATADPARAAAEVMGVYSSGPTVAAIGGEVRAGASAGPTRIAGQSTVLWLSPATVEAIPYHLKVDDRVEFIGRPPPNRWKVSALRPTDTGDLELSLTEDDL